MHPPPSQIATGGNNHNAYHHQAERFCRRWLRPFRSPLLQLQSQWDVVSLN
ncbi:hypothetical protein QNH14_23315 (plasmid) [Apirhabdus apintestini]|nr:hypothetical protein QNH14_23315 [Enterobacteriaceae bacterium CA-0114]